MADQCSLFGVEPSADFSDCGRFRWILRWPTGAGNERILAVCGGNPSKAGRRDGAGRIMSDPTISRMRNLGGELGFGWLWMVNARSYVSTDPSGVPPDPFAIGELTDAWIARAAEDCSLFLCAYGHLAGTRERRVLEIVRASGKIPHALAFTSDGKPRHPRGVPSSARPIPIPEAYRG